MGPVSSLETRPVRNASVTPAPYYRLRSLRPLPIAIVGHYDSQRHWDALISELVELHARVSPMGFLGRVAAHARVWVSVCSWCQTVIALRDRDDAGAITHGVCATCRPKALAVLS